MEWYSFAIVFSPQKNFLNFYEEYAKSVIIFIILIYGCTYKSYLKDIYYLRTNSARDILHKDINSALEISLKYKIFSVFKLHVIAVFYELFKWLREGSYDNVGHPLAQVSNRFSTRRVSEGLLNPPRKRTKTHEQPVTSK